MTLLARLKRMDWRFPFVMTILSPIGGLPFALSSGGFVLASVVTGAIILFGLGVAWSWTKP